MPVVTPTLILCDNLVNALDAAWAGRGDSDTIERDYFPRYGDGKDGTVELLQGRKVVIYPTPTEGPGSYSRRWENRSEDRYTHRVTVLVIERYTGQGLPPRSWIDDRVDFCWTYIFRGFDYRQPPSWNRYLKTADLDGEIADQVKLVTQGKLFYAEVDLVFEDLRTGV